MKHFFLLILLSLSACHKEPLERPTSERIEGVWKQEFSPHSIYSFSDGLCIQRVIYAETEVYRNEYAYTCQGDTMCLVDIVERTERRWIVDFTTETTARIETGGFVLNLKRWP
jgi:hypothetical protein